MEMIESRSIRLLDVLQRPGVQRVFVHDSVAVGVESLNVSRGTSGNLHAERALLLAQSGDVVVLAHHVDRDYRDFLARIGIGPGPDGVVVLSPDPARSDEGSKPLFEMLRHDSALMRVAERLDAGRQIRLSPYFASDLVFECGARLEALTGRGIVVEGGSASAVALSNRKDLVRQAALRLGVPWPGGELVAWHDGCPDGFDPARALVDAAGRVGSGGGSIFIRGVWSMHGSDNLRLAESDGIEAADIERWLAGRPTQRGFLVEPLLPVAVSPNVQLWIDDDGAVMHLAVTAQRLDRQMIHRGNEYPCPQLDEIALTAASETMGRWLAAAGYRGPVGLDFLVTGQAREPAGQVLLAEINGRINGATYAIGLTEQLNQRCVLGGRPPFGCWRSLTDLRTSPRCFAALADELGDLLYADGRRSGIVPYNAAMLSRGSVNLLVTGSSPDELDALEREVFALLDVGSG
jgi:hypothetical protein